MKVWHQENFDDLGMFPPPLFLSFLLGTFKKNKWKKD